MAGRSSRKIDTGFKLKYGNLPSLRSRGVGISIRDVLSYSGIKEVEFKLLDFRGKVRGDFFDRGYVECLMEGATDLLKTVGAETPERFMEKKNLDPGDLKISSGSFQLNMKSGYTRQSFILYNKFEDKGKDVYVRAYTEAGAAFFLGLFYDVCKSNSLNSFQITKEDFSKKMAERALTRRGFDPEKVQKDACFYSVEMSGLYSSTIDNINENFDLSGVIKKYF